MSCLNDSCCTREFICLRKKPSQKEASSGALWIYKRQRDAVIKYILGSCQISPFFPPFSPPSKDSFILIANAWEYFYPVVKKYCLFCVSVPTFCMAIPWGYFKVVKMPPLLNPLLFPCCLLSQSKGTRKREWAIGQWNCQANYRESLFSRYSQV